MTARSDDAERAHERILVVDDDEAMLRSVARVLRTEGFGDALTCGDPAAAVGLVESGEIALLLLDLVMPRISGETLLPQLLRAAPETPVIIVTATDQVETAVRCIQAGAFDYLVKPVDFPRLIATITRALQHRRLKVENRQLRERLDKPVLRHPEHFANLCGASPPMLTMFRHIEAIAPSPEPVLIVGETGVGKELVAQALHRASGRAGELVSLNIAGLDDGAFADTLFGHVRGAFTGADRAREGMIEKAGSGTLLLDEIGDLGREMQTKLLRLVQEREYFPLGSDDCRHSRCRVIAATHRDLRVAVRDGRFRDDLHYRLNAHLIRVPPLREHLEDLPLLVDAFLREAAAALNKPVPTPPRELQVHLAAYAFPGNVRELRAMIFDAVARHDRGVLALTAFHDHMDQTGRHDSAVGGTAAETLQFGRELPTARQALDLLIREALRRADGNQAVAARLLNMSRRTVNRFVNEQGDSPSPGNP